MERHSSRLPEMKFQISKGIFVYGAEATGETFRWWRSTIKICKGRQQWHFPILFQECEEWRRRQRVQKERQKEIEELVAKSYMRYELRMLGEEKEEELKQEKKKTGTTVRTWIPVGFVEMSEFGWLCGWCDAFADLNIRWSCSSVPKRS